MQERFGYMKLHDFAQVKRVLKQWKMQKNNVELQNKTMSYGSMTMVNRLQTESRNPKCTFER